MTTSTPDTREAWRTLEGGGGSSEFSLLTLRLEFDPGHGPVRLALGEDGGPRMLIPTGSASPSAENLSGPGVGVRSVHYIVNGRASPFIEVSSRLRELDDVFRSLSDEILRRLQAGTGAEAAVTQALEEYRDLLRRDRMHPLEWLVGLCGELHLLEALMERNAAGAGTWTGPLGQRYDFSGPIACAEVKSTLKRADAVVRVTSLEQLEPPGEGRRLLLVHQCLERSGAGGRSTSELIETLRCRAPDPGVIDRALLALGLDDWRESRVLMSERFRLLRQQVYDVRAGFPRLGVDSFRTGTVPAGVRAISYDVDLAHAAPFRLNEAEISRFLDQLAGAA